MPGERGGPPGPGASADDAPLFALDPPEPGGAPAHPGAAPARTPALAHRVAPGPPSADARLALLLALAAAQPEAPPAAPPALATLSYRSDPRYTECGANPWRPERACRLRKQGHAFLDCGATDAGALVDCRLIGEDPADFAFGEAALRMAQERWIRLAKPVASQPRSDDSRVRARVEFKLRR